MKNSLMINNFFVERPKTGRTRNQDSGASSARSGSHRLPPARKESWEPPPSRMSSEMCMSPREVSSRNSNRVSSASKLALMAKRINNSSTNFESDIEISVSDYEDEAEDEVDGNFGTSRNYWSDLDDSIKRIHDDSDKFAFKPRPNFKSSDVFKDVMTDISGNSEYGVAKGYTKLKDKISRLTNVTSITALAFSKAVSDEKEPEVAETEKEEHDEEYVQQTEEEHEKELVSAVGGAKRAWRVLKNHVMESGVEHRTTSVKMNWEALRHHVQGITDLEKARIDLYQRYGFLPTVQEDGSTVCKNVMWLNRTRARVMQTQNETLMKGRLRTQSARPFTTQNSNRPRTFSGENGINIYTRPSTSVVKARTRPSSEKVTRVRSRPSSVKTKS